MKKSFIALLLFSILLSCGPTPTPPAPKAYTVTRIVKSKKEAVETDYQYQVDPLNSFLSGDLKIRHQPKVKTVHYLVFTDGSYRTVSMGEYVVREIGDTITDQRYR